MLQKVGLWRGERRKMSGTIKTRNIMAGIALSCQVKGSCCQTGEDLDEVPQEVDLFNRMSASSYERSEAI